MRHFVFVLILSLLLAPSGVAAQTLQGDNPQYLDARNGSIDEGKYLVTLVNDRRLVFAVFGGTFDFQQQVYNTALDLRDSNIPVAFILMPKLHDNEDRAEVVLYTHNKANYQETWRVGDRAKVRNFLTPVAQYLAQWHYYANDQTFRFHEGFVFHNGRVIREHQLDSDNEVLVGGISNTAAEWWQIYDVMHNDPEKLMLWRTALRDDGKSEAEIDDIQHLTSTAANIARKRHHNYLLAKYLPE